MRVDAEVRLIKKIKLRESSFTIGVFGDILMPLTAFFNMMDILTQSTPAHIKLCAGVVCLRKSEILSIIIELLYPCKFLVFFMQTSIFRHFFISWDSKQIYDVALPMRRCVTFYTTA